MRRASIDRVNAKYLGAAPTFVGAPLVGTSTFHTPHVVGAPTVIGAPIVHHGGLRRSIINPPVYEIVEHQPVVEAVTTPGRVYEIVTPVVEVTPPQPVRQRRAGCPWWCWLLLGLLLLAILLSALGYLFRHELGLVPAGEEQENGNRNNGDNEGNNMTGVGAGDEEGLTCKQGQHLVNGKCLSCPEGSSWDGENCVKRVTNTETETETETSNTRRPDENGAGPENGSGEEPRSHLRYDFDEFWA